MLKQKTDPWLIFIDTNIFLDFYRLGGESARKQLEALERHKDSIIICDQVQMEFLKNRQKVILQSMSEFKVTASIQPPQILNDLAAAKIMTRKTKEASTQYKKLKDKLNKMIQNPQSNDPVLSSIARIFKHNGTYNLQRPDKLRHKIRERAQKRFLMGYPPRKKDDTSIGDAINWEWVIECANISEERHNIMIVSRDSDFGSIKSTPPVLNDWLQLEFKERVSKKRKIILTNKLTEALKKLDEKVTVKEVEEEADLISQKLADISENIQKQVSQTNVNHLLKIMTNVGY